MKLSLLFLVALSIVGCSREAPVAPEASTLNWAAGFPKSVPLTIVGGPRPELDAAASSNGGPLTVLACDLDASCEPSDAGREDDGGASGISWLPGTSSIMKSTALWLDTDPVGRVARGESDITILGMPAGCGLTVMGEWDGVDASAEGRWTYTFRCPRADGGRP